MLDISKLKNGTVEKLEFDEDFTFDKETLEGTDIVRLENIKAKGVVSRIESETYRVEANITGNMVMLCARSLEEVDCPLDIMIDQNYFEEASIEEKQVIFENRLDIFSIVWENIVLEVPLRVIKEDAKFINSGDGWSFKSEDEIVNASPFSELKSMLDMEGKE